MSTNMSSEYPMKKILLKCFLLFFICFLCSSNNGYANQQLSHSHIVSVSSLLPPTVCNRKPFPQDSSKATLEVVSKYSPCSKLNQGKTNTPSLEEILRKDNLRFTLKSSRRSQKSNFPDNLKQTNAHSFSAKGQDAIASEYYFTVAFGEPKQIVSLVLDTGSDATWTQCKPCGQNCFKQKNSIFNPSMSKTFTKVSCNSPLCKIILQGEGNSKCTSKECPFTIAYVDGSGYGGFWATDRLSIQETKKHGYFTQYPYLFACANNRTGEEDDQLAGESGIMGLDRSPVSFVSLTNHSYFSYCLPSSYGTTGYITFGKSNDVVKYKLVKFTPIKTTIQQSEYYDITLTGISVGGEKLPIQSSVYSKLDSLIDSGAVITRLPPAIYAALRSAFRKRMMKYKMTKPLELFDTCYDLSGYETVVVPKISFHFLGDVELDLDVRGILVVNNVRQVCLGFALFPSEPNSFTLGNVQQRGYEVHYDVAGRRLGFGPGSCN